MSGEQRLSLGGITQSTMKGKGLGSTLAKVLNNPTPSSAGNAPKGKTVQKKAGSKKN